MTSPSSTTQQHGFQPLGLLTNAVDLMTYVMRAIHANGAKWLADAELRRDFMPLVKQMVQNYELLFSHLTSPSAVRTAMQHSAKGLAVFLDPTVMLTGAGSSKAKIDQLIAHVLKSCRQAKCGPYDSTFLAQIAPVLVPIISRAGGTAGISSRKEVHFFWQETFGKVRSLAYPPELRKVFRASSKGFTLPGWNPDSSSETDRTVTPASQETLPVMPELPQTAASLVPSPRQPSPRKLFGSLLDRRAHPHERSSELSRKKETPTKHPRDLSMEDVGGIKDIWDGASNGVPPPEDSGTLVNTDHDSQMGDKNLDSKKKDLPGGLGSDQPAQTGRSKRVSGGASKKAGSVTSASRRLNLGASEKPVLETDSQGFAIIPSPSRKRMVLTEHQKEEFERQKKEVAYVAAASLDGMSQFFTTESQLPDASLASDQYQSFEDLDASPAVGKNAAATVTSGQEKAVASRDAEGEEPLQTSSEKTTFESSVKMAAKSKHSLSTRSRSTKNTARKCADTSLEADEPGLSLTTVIDNVPAPTTSSITAPSSPLRSQNSRRGGATTSKKVRKKRSREPDHEEDSVEVDAERGDSEESSNLQPAGGKPKSKQRKVKRSREKKDPATQTPSIVIEDTEEILCADSQSLTAYDPSADLDSVKKSVSKSRAGSGDIFVSPDVSSGNDDAIAVKTVQIPRNSSLAKNADIPIPNRGSKNPAIPVSDVDSPENAVCPDSQHNPSTSISGGEPTDKSPAKFCSFDVAVTSSCSDEEGEEGAELINAQISKSRENEGLPGSNRPKNPSADSDQIVDLSPNPLSSVGAAEAVSSEEIAASAPSTSQTQKSRKQQTPHRHEGLTNRGRGRRTTAGKSGGSKLLRKGDLTNSSAAASAASTGIIVDSDGFATEIEANGDLMGKHSKKRKVVPSTIKVKKPRAGTVDKEEEKTGTGKPAKEPIAKEAGNIDHCGAATASDAQETTGTDPIALELKALFARALEISRMPGWKREVFNHCIETGKQTTM